MVDWIAGRPRPFAGAFPPNTTVTVSAADVMTEHFRAHGATHQAVEAMMRRLNLRRQTVVAFYWRNRDLIDTKEGAA